MHKNLFSQPIVLGLILVALSCAGKKESEEKHEEHHDQTGETWQEMDDFHMVMAESFHPYKDSSNLEPAKQNAPAMVQSSEKWLNAPLPEKFKGDDEIKFKLTQLKTDALAFEEVVKSGNDKAVGASLTKLHDLFHQLQEAWYGEPNESH